MSHPLITDTPHDASSSEAFSVVPTPLGQFHGAMATIRLLSEAAEEADDSDVDFEYVHGVAVAIGVELECLMGAWR